MYLYAATATISLRERNIYYIYYIHVLSGVLSVPQGTLVCVWETFRLRFFFDGEACPDDNLKGILSIHLKLGKYIHSIKIWKSLDFGIDW